MSRTNEEIVQQIKDIIETHIKPAVAGHGGVINFKDFNDGELLVELSGACAGCAGSKMTLKMGVERFMKANVPEVEIVEAVDDENTDAKPFYTQEDLDDLNHKDV